MDSKNVLFVEDEKLVHTLFNKYAELNKIKHHFTKVFSVSEALKKLEEENFDAMICDFYLEDGTAFDIAEQYSHVPMIIATGTGSESLAVRSIKLGVFDYVVKNIDEQFFDKLFQSLENALHYGTSEMMLKNFIHIAGVLIIGLNSDLTVNYINKKGCDMLGKKKKHILEMDFIDTLIPENRRVTARKEVLELFSADKGSKYVQGSFEMPVMNSFHNEIPIMWNFTLYRDKKDSNIGILLSGEDFSKVKEMEHLKDEFVSIVSHEIRNPISSVKGLVDLMLLREMDKEKTHHYLNIIQSELLRLDTLTRDLLDIQKIEMGKVEFQYQELLLTELIQDIYTFYVDGQNKKINLFMKPDPVLMTGDYDKIKQLLLNILSNAFKYSPDNAEVSMTVEDLGSDVKVQIRDQGLGIPAEALPKLFTKFYRVGTHEHLERKGTGLGLAICKEIALAHDGHISVESEPGKGSNFIVMLSKTKNK